MKLKYIQNRGFTLVEVLVVAAVVAVLFSISTPIVLRQMEKAKLLEAKTTMKDIEMALPSFLKDHGVYDYKDAAGLTERSLTAAVGGPFTNAAATEPAGNFHLFLRGLLGENTSLTKYSRTNKKYLILKDAVDLKNGVVRAPTGEVLALVDPWGRHYQAFVDVTRGSGVNKGFYQNHNNAEVGEYAGDKITYQNGLAMICAGSDGLFDKKDDASTFNTAD